MPNLFRPFARFGRLMAAMLLLLLAALAVMLAFPGLHGMLKSPITNVVLLVLLALFVAVALHALWKRRWLSALFHAGAAVLIVGGGVTAGWAKSWDVWLVDSPIAPPEMRQRVIGGELVALKSFEIESYPNGMPKQYRTRLIFPDGVGEVSVNRPLRRKGFTYYQMSYSKGTDPYGKPVFQTALSVRRDPGAPVVFVGYGILTFAALLMALREMRP